MRSPNSQEESKSFLKFKQPPARSTRYGPWGLVFWPIAAHAVIAIGIALTMLLYINENNFNITDRRPSVTLADEVVVPWTHLGPLQSDVTTLVSVLLALLRLISASWLGPLCWRCAFILLETAGLRGHQLHAMISYGIPIAPRRGKRRITYPILVLLSMVLPVQLVAPVLTGSITWVASRHPLERLSDVGITFPADDADAWDQKHTSTDDQRQEYVQHSLIMASTIWGRNPRNTVMSRVYNSMANLPINSTLSNVTLPYFTIAELEWVKDPYRDLTGEQISVEKALCSRLNFTGESLCTAYPRLRWEGSFGLVPDAPWNRIGAHTLSERRLVALYTGRSYGDRDCREPKYSYFFPDDPAHAGIALDPTSPNKFCYIFAWVTYVAGAGICRNCRVSAPATVQNDTGIELVPSYYSTMALHMAPNVIIQMLAMSTVQLKPEWKNLDEHVTGLLTRAYAASWLVLANRITVQPSYMNATYSVSPVASKAVVDSTRVYIWLGLQGLVTVSGLLFFYVQVVSGSPIIHDTTLSAFFLDSSSLSEDNQYGELRGGAVQRVEASDGLIRMKVE